jgi:NADH-quinone oxidoreductase subunit J
MHLENIVDFYIILLLSLIGCSIFMLISNNSVHSVLYLILCFFHAAIILIIFKVEFLSLAFIIIYVGAIAVLFLFVVMMLNIKEDKVDITLQEFFIPLIFFLSFYYILTDTFLNLDYTFFSFYSFYDNLTNINILGQLLYNYVLFHILVAGFILLIAIIGPVILTLNFNNRKDIVSYNQLARNENVVTFFTKKL